MKITTRSQAGDRIADRTASQQTLTYRENYLCARSAFPIQSFMPNFKPLAQVVLRYCALSVLGHEFDLLRSLDVIGHVTIR